MDCKRRLRMLRDAYAEEFGPILTDDCFVVWVQRELGCGVFGEFPRRVVTVPMRGRAGEDVDSDGSDDERSE